MRALKVIFGILCLQYCSALWAADALVVGTASIVAGAVSALAANGEARLLSKGDAVYSGDRVVTAAAGYARLGFLDGSSIVLRPNTEFAIESFRFQPGAVESAIKRVPAKPLPASTPAAELIIANQGGVGNQAFFRLVRGGFRAVSGLVGKLNREEYAVRTPIATIGIRGTVYWSVVCDAACASDAMVQGALPAGEAALGGAVSGVDQGGIVMVSITGQSVVVNPSQFVFTTAAGTHVVLPGLPGFMSAEAWLNVAQQAAVAPPSAPSPVLANSALSVVPTIGSIAATVLIGAVVLTSDMQSGNDNTTSPPATTSTTGTVR